MTSARVARTLALLITGLVIGLTIRYNTFAAWATDSGAYISAGHAWARGELFEPASFVFWAPWAAEGQVEMPLGHVQGPVKGTITGQYPLGYPVLLAAAIRLGGDLAPHLVSPLLAGVLAWCVFLLGRRMVTAWAGAAAALLVAFTPVVLGHTVIPFSDVPAAAFWAMAWLMSVGRGHGAAAASGAATALAVMIRPNLAPLAVVIAAAVLATEREGWRRAMTRLVVFGVLAAIGPLLVLWSQAVLYGHPLQSGYRVPMSFFFDLERVPYNAGLYPRMLGELHSWLALGGLAYAPFALRGWRTTPDAHTRAVLAGSALGLILINYALYLPYLTYVGWYWLRFLLPALVALFLLLAAGLDELRLVIARRAPRLAYLALVPAVVVAWMAEEHIRPQVGYERMQLMERYLPHVLPPNAVILTYAHGGALAAATGRPILRVDYIEGDALDRVIDAVQRRGFRPVYVFDVAVEADFVGTRFKGSQAGRLTWPARAELASSTSIVYYDLADRERFASGARWPIDVLVAGRSTQANVDWSDLRVEHERVILPLPEETAAFRTSLEAVYRDQLARGAAPAAVDAADSLRWLGRYLRLRLHRCDHEEASARLWAQMAGGPPPALCGTPDTVGFPAEDETLAFSRALAERLPRTAPRQPPTAVDPLGEVVWTQRYLEARVRGCSHGEATESVVAQITGRSVNRACDTR